MFSKVRCAEVLQSDAHTKALGELQRYGSVHKLLLLKVSTRGRWDKEDVESNNCSIYFDGQIDPSLPILKDLVQFQNSLSDRRPYSVTVQSSSLVFYTHLFLKQSSDNDTGFTLSKTHYGPQFEKVFVKTLQASGIDARESLSFFVLNHSFLKDTVSASQDSSSFKAGVFCHFFIHTPFLYIRSSARLEYKQ